MLELQRAAQFLKSNWRELLSVTADHLVLVLIATTVALLIGLPLGILLTRRRKWQPVVLGVTGVLQTVPSLALFGLLIPLPLIGGIGARTAIVALVLYALLPVVRNTVTGIEGVNRSVREAAVGLGMTDWQVLWQIELPLASSVILAGVRVATVVSVGVATIAAFIGAGGLGTYIQRGLRMNDNVLLLAGALPAALLALAADWLLGRVERSINGNQASNRRKPYARSTSLKLLTACLLIGAVVVGVAFVARNLMMASDGEKVIVGSKDFTESVILAELVAQVLEEQGVEVERRFELGGNLAHEALIANQISIYPEYTGTALVSILHLPPMSDAREVHRVVEREYAARYKVEVSRSLGFNNDFAILVRGETARRLGLTTVSEAVPHARTWQAGFGQDFLSRPDGYAGFVQTYKFEFAKPPREMDLSLTYRALASKNLDLIAGNSTDGLIRALDLVQLEDNRKYFPPYEAVLLVNQQSLSLMDTAARGALKNLEGSITVDEMRRLNYEVDGRRRAVKDVVREWRQVHDLDND